MSEINSVSNIGANQQINSGTSKVTGGTASSFSSYMKETKNLDQIFEKAAAKYVVPANLLKAIGKAESDFRPHVVSKSGAQGVMQLMPKTAEYLGVKDPFDPEQNIMGGAKYIKELLDKYDGDTKLALAAYNAGMNNVKKYGGIPPFKETQNYVVKVTEYMNQNVQAGTVKVDKSSSSEPVVSKANVPVMNTTPPSWFIAPSELTAETTNAGSSDLTDLLSAFFSYDDYLKLLEIFFRDQDNEDGYSSFL